MVLLSLQNTPASLLGTPKRATVLRAVPPRNIRCRIYAHSSTSSSTSNSTTSKSASTSTSSSQLYKCMEKRVDVSPPPEASVWNPFQRAVAALLNKVDESISVLEKRYALSPTVDPNVQLAGNFAPVSETAEEDVLIHGTLPSCIENGVYVRNGANPMFPPAGGHHLFDGDGMLHAVSFKEGGRATYCCRYTRTYRLNLEEKLQRTVFPKAIGELHGHAGIVRLLIYYARACFGLVDLNQGMGVANAGVVYFNGRLLAMSEDDLPYHVQITEAGGLRTNGRYDFNGQLKFSTIAHPKLDPHTGELLTLSYDVLKKPYLRFLKFSPTGVKSSEVNISLQQPTMIHDFAITERFVIIPDQQVVFRLQDLLRGGSPVMHDKSKVSRFGVLPRGDSDESRIVWVDVPDCFCFHLWNAWEEEVEGELEEIVVIGSCMTPPDAMFNESLFSVKCVLSEIRLNLRTGTSTRRAIVDDLNLEAGQVNRNYLGRRSRYVYMSIVEPWPRVSGVAKVDLMSHKGGGEEPSNNVVAKITYPEGCYGGEPFFVPQNDSADEDDGYVLTYMHNEKTGESKVLVLDATSPSLKPVASVKLPSRVPYGFHGTFIASSDLERQTPPEI